MIVNDLIKSCLFFFFTHEQIAYWDWLCTVHFAVFYPIIVDDLVLFDASRSILPPGSPKSASGFITSRLAPEKQKMVTSGVGNRLPVSLPLFNDKDNVNSASTPASSSIKRLRRSPPSRDSHEEELCIQVGSLATLPAFSSTLDPGSPTSLSYLSTWTQLLTSVLFGKHPPSHLPRVVTSNLSSSNLSDQTKSLCRPSVSTIPPSSASLPVLEAKTTTAERSLLLSDFLISAPSRKQLDLETLSSPTDPARDVLVHQQTLGRPTVPSKVNEDDDCAGDGYYDKYSNDSTANFASEHKNGTEVAGPVGNAADRLLIHKKYGLKQLHSDILTKAHYQYAGSALARKRLNNRAHKKHTFSNPNFARQDLSMSTFQASLGSPNHSIPTHLLPISNLTGYRLWLKHQLLSSHSRWLWWRWHQHQRQHDHSVQRRIKSPKCNWLPQRQLARHRRIIARSTKRTSAGVTVDPIDSPLAYNLQLVRVPACSSWCTRVETLCPYINPSETTENESHYHHSSRYSASVLNPCEQTCCYSDFDFHPIVSPNSHTTSINLDESSLSPLAKSFQKMTKNVVRGDSLSTRATSSSSSSINSCDDNNNDTEIGISGCANNAACNSLMFRCMRSASTVLTSMSLSTNHSLSNSAPLASHIPFPASRPEAATKLEIIESGMRPTSSPEVFILNPTSHQLDLIGPTNSAASSRHKLWRLSIGYYPPLWISCFIIILTSIVSTDVWTASKLSSSRYRHRQIHCRWPRWLSFGNIPLLSSLPPPISFYVISVTKPQAPSTTFPFFPCFSQLVRPLRPAGEVVTELPLKISYTNFISQFVPGWLGSFASEISGRLIFIPTVLDQVESDKQAFPLHCKSGLLDLQIEFIVHEQIN
ncbi:unnamed protein product [Protopolystoma xenopodis]|uniref:Uncharacterized protein n=1 Tax=Protopolystoma xenopodis TaxID=117903 RepID=A0A3S5CGX6_9PLAT|nr:unnamed protein product [Protopolystoma xenopodis]